MHINFVIIQNFKKLESCTFFFADLVAKQVLNLHLVHVIKSIHDG